MARRSVGLSFVMISVALVAAACSAEGDATTTTTVATTTQSTTTSAEATTTTAETTTTEAATTTSPPTGLPNATLAITAVAFGPEGYVEITNLSNTTASLDGYWVCQQPSYFQLSGSVEPGQSIRFAAADSTYGALNVEGGALGLYTSADFGSSDAIIGYVAWGPSGHGRLSVAVAAGVWTQGSSVDSTGASLITATAPASISAEGWAAG